MSFVSLVSFPVAQKLYSAKITFKGGGGNFYVQEMLQRRDSQDIQAFRDNQLSEILSKRLLDPEILRSEDIAMGLAGSVGLSCLCLAHPVIATFCGLTLLGGLVQKLERPLALQKITPEAIGAAIEGFKSLPSIEEARFIISQPDTHQPAKILMTLVTTDQNLTEKQIKALKTKVRQRLPGLQPEEIFVEYSVNASMSDE